MDKHKISMKLGLMTAVLARFSVFEVTENATGKMTVSLTYDQCNAYRHVLWHYPELFYFGMTGVWESADFWAKDANLSNTLLKVFSFLDDRDNREARVHPKIRFWVHPRSNPTEALFYPYRTEKPGPEMSTSAGTLPGKMTSPHPPKKNAEPKSPPEDPRIEQHPGSITEARRDLVRHAGEGMVYGS